jgi:hypothetical protein
MTEPDEYRPSWRKPAGAFLILAIIALWAGIVLALTPWIGRMPALVQALVYLAFGIGWLWVMPLKAILRWSETGSWR